MFNLTVVRETMMPSPRRLRFATALCLTTLVGSGLACAAGEPLTTAKLLVDLARNHGLDQAGRQTLADVQLVRTLLRAAVRLDPTLVEAHIWLCELATLQGDEAEVARTLTDLLNADPTHAGAFERWLAAGLRVPQTIEERQAWLEAVAAVPRPPPLTAMVHVALARLALERLDVAEAARQLTLAQELEPASLDAALLTLETLGPDATAARRLRALLRVLGLSPLSTAIAAEIGALLDDHGFAEEAGRFLDYALDVQQQRDPQQVVPAAFRLTLAHNLHARGEDPRAVENASLATADPATAAEAGLYLYYLLQRTESYTAVAVREQLARRFAAVREPAQHPVNEVAQAAWFYCTVDPQPDRALMLARAAAERAPTDVFGQRVLGWAQAAGLQREAALATLRPIAGRDAFAAYRLAQLLHEAGDERAACQVLGALDPPPRAGPAADLLGELRRTIARGAAAPVADSQPVSQPVAASRPAPDSQGAPETAPAVPPASQPASRPAYERYPEIVRALMEFDARVLSFYREPGRFVEADVRIEDPSINVGQPWWAVFRLTNRSPWPVTLGPDAMVNPVFLLSFEAEGDRRREFPALLTISLDRVRVLRPGETAELRQTLDIGPLAHVARQSPQQLQRVVVHPLLDAVQRADGHWEPSPGGQALRPAYFNRLPANTGPDSISALFAALTRESRAVQVRAADVLAQLLGERQRADWQRLEYRPAPVPADRIQAALLNLLGSDSWELRARTLAALDVVGLDRPLYAAVESSLAHAHWLVRMMALRNLARQGSACGPHAEKLANEDPDELVRALARSYLAMWQPPPASAPADATSDNPGAPR